MPDAVPIVISANPEPLDPEAVLVAAAARGLPLFAIDENYLPRTRQELDGRVAKAGIVLMPHPQMQDIDVSLSSSAFGAATLDYLRQGPTLKGEMARAVGGAPL